MHQSEVHFPVIELLGFHSAEEIENNMSEIYNHHQIQALTKIVGRHLQSWHEITKFLLYLFYFYNNFKISLC